jgi:sodium/hydrogen exchanger 8
VATYLIQSYRVVLLPPSSSALLLGVFFGIVSRIFGLTQALRFSPAAFFYALLPPIVFAAGFTLKKRSFFDNIGAILTYAVLGTFISAIVFGTVTYSLVLMHVISPKSLGAAPFAECFMYGAAISSIDPVATLAVLAQSDTPPILYNLVFGESVLNDAVAIVLFRSIENAAGSSMNLVTIPRVLFQFSFLLVGSLVVGVGVGLACAFLLKRFDAYWKGGGKTLTGSHAKPQGLSISEQFQGGTPAGLNDGDDEEGGGYQSIDPTMYEISIMVMGSYLAYLVAEVVGMSGIVALFFTGICHSHYSYYNVSSETQVACRRLFEVGAFLCELFVFAYLGLQVATMNHSFDFGLLISGIPLAVLSRAVMIVPCTKLVNHYRKNKLPDNMMRMMWAVGLRGAVAYGLVVNMPSGQEKGDGEAGIGIPAIETATLMIAVASSLILGSATGPLLKHFDLEGKTDAEVYTKGWSDAYARGEVSQASSEHQYDTSPSKVHSKFKEIDRAILKPVFGGRLYTGSNPREAETEVLLPG